MAAPEKTEKIRRAGPVFGLWLLVCAGVPMLIVPSGHGSIFWIGPPFILGFVGSILHTAAIYFLPVRALQSVGVAIVIAGSAAVITLFIWAAIWHENIVALAQIMGWFMAAIFILALCMAVGISQLYLGRVTDRQN
jgi:hypothetical protein